MQADEMKYIVYVAINQRNGTKYVGFTGRGLESRKSAHEKSADRGQQTYFYNALRKYGPESFKWYVIGWSVNAEDIKAQEIAHIKFYKSLGEELYNMTDGGDGTVGHTYTPTVERLEGMREQLARARTPEHQRKAGRNGGHRTKEAKLAIFAIPAEKKSEISRRAGLTNMRNRTGLFGRTQEQMSKDGCKADRVSGAMTGRRHYENKTGLFGRVAERWTADSRKGLQSVIDANPNHQRDASYKGKHVRWHTRRNIVKLDCKFCNPNAQQIYTQAAAA